LGIGSSNAAKIQTMMLVWIASSIFFFNGGMNLTLSAWIWPFQLLFNASQLLRCLVHSMAFYSSTMHRWTLLFAPLPHLNFGTKGKKEDPINSTPEESESEKLLQQLVILSCAAVVNCVMGVSTWNDMLSIFSLATACPTWFFLCVWMAARAVRKGWDTDELVSFLCRDATL
jgi:hypothetical protein